MTEFPEIDRKKFPCWIELSAVRVLEHFVFQCTRSSDPYVFDDGSSSVFDGLSEDQKNEMLAKFERLNRCLTSRDLESVWKKINSIYQNDTAKSQAWFASVISNSLVASTHGYVPKKEAEEWKEKMQAALQAAESLMRDIPTNFHGWNRVHAKKNFKDYVDDILYEMSQIPCSYTYDQLYWLFQSGKLTPANVIQSLNKSLDETMYDPNFFGKHISGKNAERRYFIRSLTGHLTHKVGQPLRKVVAKTVSVAFVCDLPESEITKKTKDLPENLEETNSIASYIEWFDATYDALYRDDGVTEIP